MLEGDTPESRTWREAPDAEWSLTPFNLWNADLYIIILLRRIIEYNKGNLSVIKVTVAFTLKDADSLSRRLKC
jgi:hypothetical protein